MDRRNQRAEPVPGSKSIGNALSYGGIDHLGIAVHDLEAATALYRDALGFELSGGETLPERGLEVRFFETGNARIELLSPTRANSEVSGFLKTRGEGLHHVSITVGDVDAAVARMRERGVRIIGDGVQRGANGTRVAFIHPRSANGVLLELVESPSESP